MSPPKTLEGRKKLTLGIFAICQKRLKNRRKLQNRKNFVIPGIFVSNPRWMGERTKKTTP
jgi:hypothetical protein